MSVRSGDIVKRESQSIDRWRKKDVEMMKEVHESDEKDQGRQREKRRIYTLYGVCHTLRSKAERRADEDKLRW